MKKNMILLSALLLCLTACGPKTDPALTEAQEETTEKTEVTETEAPEPPTNAPFPEADPNGVDFSDGDYSFAQVLVDDDGCAEGSLSVEEVDGNAMLKFTPTNTTQENYTELVPKIKFDVLSLLSPDQLESVYSIQFDVYASGEADWFVNEDGDKRQVPGWIGGGCGTLTADGEWYGFSDFSSSNINEFDLERSDGLHVECKFLLASAGKCWNADMEEVFLQFMRWGVQNLSCTYIDNLTFYDKDGNSLELHRSIPENVTEAAAETKEGAGGGQ